MGGGGRGQNALFKIAMKQYLGCLMILQAEHFYDSCEAMFKITYFKLPLWTDRQMDNANSRVAWRLKIAQKVTLEHTGERWF